MIRLISKLTLRFSPSRRTILTRHTFRTLISRLSHAGFKKDFVKTAILPDWWDESCENDTTLLPDIEIRVARFLGLPVSELRSSAPELASPRYAGAQLRQVRDIDRDRLAPAIHAAVQISQAVVRNLRNQSIQVRLPPPDGLSWRNLIVRSQARVTLADILDDLWQRGIPTVLVDVLPSPSFQGAAVIVQGRPVIVIGHKIDVPGRMAHIISHETGHLASGDCTQDHPVVDEDDQVVDESVMENNAERYARRVLVGGDNTPQVHGRDFRELAKQAMELELSTGAEATSILGAWAKRIGTDHAHLAAAMAIKALYRGSGAKQLLRKHFEANVDFESATESDRGLLRCVYGGQDHNADID